MRFSMREKRSHYSAVANGTKPTKANSKFSKKEQQAYARGQRDALNESARITAYKNATPIERQVYAETRRKKYEEYKASKK